jgi:Protein of unknown function (DUF4054)
VADITWIDVTDVAPNNPLVANYPTGGQAKVLALVNCDLKPGDFGGVDSPRYRLARAYLAAHFASTRLYIATAQSEGGVSQSFAAPPMGDLQETAYGRAYCDLLVAPRAGIVL